MSAYSDLSREAISKKIWIVELDIGQEHQFWHNWAAGVWYVNFDLVYPLIDSSFLAGEGGRTVTRIGSVKSDGLSLSPVSSAADVQANELSFFYDGGTKTLYIHLQNGDEPALHLVFFGEVIGVSNVDGVYNDFIYESRLLSIPDVSRSRDPLFFGKIAFGGGRASVRNDDGAFDRFGEDYDVFGNSGRILQGFEGQAYEDFRQQFSGFIEDLSIGPKIMEVALQDKRAFLSRKVPDAVFDQTTYPDLKDQNVGKSIPIGYGVMQNVPVVCTNEAESPAPATYSFKLFDTAHHAIKAMDQVYVKGIAKTHGGEDLANATFTLAAADYSPGDEVTCDCQGYVDANGVLIANALDVILDMLVTYFPLNYNANFFNTGEWNVSRLAAPDINYFAREPVEVISIIEEISSSVFGLFLVEDGGRYSYRIYNQAAAAVQTITRYELLELPLVEYDPKEILTSTRVGYAKDWAAGELRYLHDISQQADLFRQWKVYREKTFPTLLTTAAAAQDFSDKVLQLSAGPKRIFVAKTKMQTALRQIGDMINVEVYRRREKLLGMVKAEVVGVSKSADENGVTLTCRIVELILDTVYQQGSYYGDSYYGDTFYSTTQNLEVA